MGASLAAARREGKRKAAAMAEWLDEDLRLVRAANPGPLTGPGTNTWILGRGRVAVIDPGPPDRNHLEAILATLDPGEEVAAILVTHAHLDHSALAPAFSARTGAPTHAFGPAHSGRSALMQDLAEGGLASGGEGFDEHFRPDVRLADGDVLELDGLRIEAIHCPGHTGCHMAFAASGRLFPGDHVMGWATSIVSPPDGDMAAYMTSLARLAARDWRAAFPGHGEPLLDPAARIAELTRHRLQREDEILLALAPRPATPADLVAEVYAATDRTLWPAAERSLLAHLIKLWQEGRVTARPGPGPKALFARTTGT
jgi:hydroxyacylglutathione hydrolase